MDASLLYHLLTQNSSDNLLILQSLFPLVLGVGTRVEYVAHGSMEYLDAT